MKDNRTNNADKAPKEETSNQRTNRKPNRRDRRNRAKVSRDKFYDKTKGSNDLSWHSPDAELLHRSATIPWSYQTGEMIRTNRSLISLPSTPTPVYASQSGFVKITTAVTCGGIGDSWNYQNQPSYTAANSLLTTMRSRTRVRNTYDAPDVMMLMLAMDNIYAFVAFCKRIAATVKMYSFQNHFMPRDLIRAQGCDPEWFEKNQFTFVTQLNVIISEINKVYIPSRMHLFELHNQRFSNYYTEGSSIKDQIYFFNPGFFSEIDYNATEDYQSMLKPIICFPGTANVTDGIITSCNYNSGALHDGDDLLATLRQMLTRIIEHDATADITGDMENAFGSSDRFILGNCDADAIAAPIFDEEILETIHNCTVFYGPRAIYQSYRGDSMLYPYFATVQDVRTNRIGTYDLFHVQKNDAVLRILTAEASFTLLDVHRDPTPEKTFAITRLRNVISHISSTDTNYVVQCEFGADLVLNVEFYDYSLNANGDKILGIHGFDSVIRHQATLGSMNLYTSMAPFHYRPLAKVTDANYLEYGGQWYVGETDIYSEIPDLDTIKNMNRLSLLTLLGAYNNV